MGAATMSDDSRSHRETREHLCPHCLSVEILPSGHVFADRNGIRSEYLCRECVKEFVLLLD
jgi:DNA-directed RNA polymerase subunit RPC12/RpoP